MDGRCTKCNGAKQNKLKEEYRFYKDPMGKLCDTCYRQKRLELPWEYILPFFIAASTAIALIASNMLFNHQL